MDEELVNRFGGLSLPRKSVVRLTDRPDMILDVNNNTIGLPVVRTLNPKKCNFNAPAIRKNFFSKFDKYNILAL